MENTTAVPDTDSTPGSGTNFVLVPSSPVIVLPTTARQERDNRLDDLVVEINRYRREADQAASENLETRRTIGRALGEAKTLVKQVKFSGGWRKWCEINSWGTRWADSLIRLHTQWPKVQDAMKWMADSGVEIPDGVTAALKAITEHKRAGEPDEEKELREVKSRRKNETDRNKAVARFLRDVLRTGTVPDERPVELREFLVEVLKEDEDGDSEQRAAHSNDAEFDEAAPEREDVPVDGVEADAEAAPQPKIEYVDGLRADVRRELQAKLDADIAEVDAQRRKAARRKRRS